VLSLPALHAIRAHWPEAEVVILARSWVADLYRHQDCADRLLVYDHRGNHAGFWGREGLVRELRGERFDLAILLQNAFEAAWLAWRARIPQRVGYARDRRSWLLTGAIAVPRHGEISAHQSYYYLELLRRAGWLDRLPDVDAIRLRVPDAARIQAEQTLTNTGARQGSLRIAIAPGAAYGSAKCWLPERYAELADSLIEAAGADVIIFGAPPEREMAERIVRAMKGRAINLAGQTSIGELPALLQSCQLFVGNDSGAMHVAGAVGLPVVGIFGPTDPEATRPATPQFTLIREPVSCSPCLLRHCPIDHRCMTRISTETVFGVARALLEGRAKTNPSGTRSAGLV
jgi:heptosyltransferase-2